jgi:deoxyadenosine/deoxycytidine kinase
LDQLLAQIKKRGRSFEQDIKSEYLEQLETGYSKLLQDKLPFPIVAISLENIDFEKDETAFQMILRTIFRNSF